MCRAEADYGLLSRRQPGRRTARRVSIISARRKGRQDLAADLAFRVSLSMDVDVPLAGLP